MLHSVWHLFLAILFQKGDSRPHGIAFNDGFFLVGS